MSGNRTSMPRAVLAAAIFGGGALLWVIGQGPAMVAAAAQAQAQGQPAARGGAGGGASSFFTGGTPSRVDTKMTVSSLKFPKGSRSNWHSHANGQLLMVQEGKALTQERGGQVREVGPSQPWWTAANVEHWHGATADTDLVQMTIYDGNVKWLEPVTDEQYKAAPKR